MTSIVVSRVKSTHREAANESCPHDRTVTGPLGTRASVVLYDYFGTLATAEIIAGVMTVTYPTLGETEVYRRSQ